MQKIASPQELQTKLRSLLAYCQDAPSRGVLVAELRELADRVASPDHSTNPTVVEYAVRFLFKRKSVRVAARATAAKLSGQQNYFIGDGAAVQIDPKKLEGALWGRLVDRALENIRKFKAGKEAFAVGAVVNHFNLGKRDSSTLEKLVVKELGRPLQNY